MAMEYMTHLREHLCDELEEMSEKESMNHGDLETVNMIVNSVYKLDKMADKYSDMSALSGEERMILEKAVDILKR